MNDERDPNLRQKTQQINNVITAVMVYVVSGFMIVYGGVNVSFNVLQGFRGMYTGQWTAAIPFVLLFGVLPVAGGILLLMFHPATRTTKPKSRS